MQEELYREFKSRFTDEPRIFKSPGRVNIIGEHTDYNDGFVLPAAIDKYIYVAVSKRADGEIKLFAKEFDAAYNCTVERISKSSEKWPNYILGVVDQLLKNGHSVSGFNLVIDGDVPTGAGLSSSAAVECATIFALNTIFNLNIDKLVMVKMAQKAEHEFAGVMCGIMDQFASMMGRENHVIRLDCRSLEYEYVPFNLTDYKIVLLNTNVKHELADSEYNVRRHQCEEGVSAVKLEYPSVNSLRDVTKAMLEESVSKMSSLVFRRCKYIIEENQRLLRACEDLKQNNIKALGEKMFATHEGLSKEYEVSCKELDFLVEYVKQFPAVAGARMMGGGFGGCTINLVENNFVRELIAKAEIIYKEKMNLPLSHYIAVIGDGTMEVKVPLI